MADGERRQRVISSTPRISPEEIANRAFGSSFRGYAENEVRSFLGRVSEELTAAREREDQLLATLDDLEERLRAPKPLDEQELLEALGEETARLLRTAREASEDIRRKAEERSASVMEDAQAEAHRLRTEAAEILTVRSQEAEGVAAGIVGDAEARAAEVTSEIERTSGEQRQRADDEAGAIVESARQQGREMLDAARVARERVLTDLGRRRTLLQAQIEELRQGRDRLLDAYRVVKRTFLDATEALSQVEARAASERAQATAEAAAAGALTPDADRELIEEFESGGIDVDTAVAATPSSDLPDVDSLFARLRAGQDEPPPEPEPEAPESDAPESEAEVQPEDVQVAREAIGVVEGGAVDDEVDVESVKVVETAPIEIEEPEPEPEAESESAPEPEPEPEPESASDESEPERGASTPADAWRARHSEAIEPLAHGLVRQAKRTAQDEQNGLLDAVRRYKGRPAADQVLPDDDATVEAWTSVLRPSLGTAYTAGREAVGAPAVDVPDSVLREAAESIAFPLRERLATAIDDTDSGETHGLVERIGARYREWKNQRLERTVGDVLVVAWTNGVYDGAADGTVLQWLPLVEGRCSDCDDNALEPTVKGETFPTGQPRPPAHPGCRCLLAPESALAPSDAT